jgi:hypothetical protein
MLQKGCGENVCNDRYDRFLSTLSPIEKRLLCKIYLITKNERE